MQALKIGLVIDTSLDKTDGVQQYVLTLGAWLTKQGHEVHYLTGQTKRTDLPNLHSLSRNIMVRFNGNRLSMPLPAPRRRIRQLMQQEQFDVLHVQTPYSPWLAQRIIQAAPAGTAVIATFHIVPQSWLVRAGSRLLALWERRSLKRLDQVLSVSTAAQSFARQTFGLSSKVLPNVVDYRRFADAKPLADYDDAVPTLLFFGPFSSRKGCQFLLQAAARLHQTTPALPFRVLICGRGPLEASLKSYVAEQKLTDLVSFIGYVEENDKPRYYASADLAVFPSTGGESFGIVLIEAMASGRAAVLAGDNSGYRTVLSERPDLLFNPQNIPALAGQLGAYLQNSEQRRQAAAWGQAHARQFDTTVVGKQVVAAYAQALRLKKDLP